jgi:hypothetical protein
MHDADFTSDATPLLSIVRMCEVACFHSPIRKAVTVSDGPGLIEIVVTLETFSAIRYRLSLVGTEVNMSTCNEHFFERWRKVEILAISSSPF